MKTFSKFKKIHLLSLFLICIFIFANLLLNSLARAAAGVPMYINFQGRLMDSTGLLLGSASGTDYCFKFSIYDATTGGSKIWPTGSPSRDTLTVRSGVFDATIGEADTLNLTFTDDQAYVNVEVATMVGPDCTDTGGAESFETLTPRPQIVSSGFAINSKTVGGFTPAQSATDSQIPVLTSGAIILGHATTAGLTSAGAAPLAVDAGSSGVLNLNNTSSGNILLGGGSASTGCTLTNSSGAFACTAGLTGTTINATSALQLGGTDINTAGTLSNVAYENQVNTFTANNIFQPTVTTGTGATAGLQIAANSLTTGNALDVSTTSLTTGNLVSLASTSTAAGSNTQTVLKVATSGANATSTQTTYGGHFSNTHTGTSSSNVGLYSTASGGSNNYAAIFDAGNVGIGTTSPASKLTIDSNSNSQAIRIFGATEASEIGDIYMGGGYMVLDTTAGTSGLGFIDLRSEDDEYGIIIRESSGAGIGSYANIYLTDASNDYLNFCLNCTKAGVPGLVLFDNGGDDLRTGLGTASPGAKLDVNIIDYTGVSAEMIGFRLQNTVQALSSGGTIANWRAGQFIAPTINGVAGGATETVTTAATLYVDAAPSGSDITFTNGPYSLWVDAGLARFDGDLIVGGSTSITETLANTGFSVGGDDLFVAGLAGIEGNVYTDGSFIAGASTTISNGSISQSSGETLTIGTTSANLVLQTTTSGTLNLSPAGNLNLTPSSFVANVGGGTSRTGLRFLEPSGTGTDYAGIQSNADVTTSYTWTLPAADASGCIQSNGSGALSISACGGGTTWNGISNPTGTQSLTFDDGELNAWTVSSDTEIFHTITANSLTTGQILSIASSSITSGALIDLAITGTGGLTDQKGLNISLSGANGTGGQTTYGAYLSNTHTGTSTNVGLYATASGGSNNYAGIFAAGNVGIGTTAPDRPLEVNSATGLGARLTYNDADGSAVNYTDLQVGSSGQFNISPSGFIANLGGGTTETALRFLEDSDNGTDYAAIKAPASVTTSYTWTLPAADASGCVQSNGSGTLSVSTCGDTNIQSWTSGTDNTWTKPTNALFVIVEAWGAGGAGAGGAGGSSGSVRSGGGGGGGGAYVTNTYQGSFFSGNQVATVGAGPSGSAGSANGGTPSDASAGGNSCFSSTSSCGGTVFLTAGGGGGGAGTSTTGSGGGGGGGQGGAGSGATTATGATGGGQGGSATNTAADGFAGAGGATASTTAVSGGLSQYGGAGGGASTTTGTNNSGAGGSTYKGGAGGAAGGTSATGGCFARNGGDGGTSPSTSAGGGGTAGTGSSSDNGGAGGNGADGDDSKGGQGGGGGGNACAGASNRTGGNGGNGGARGGGGGGGGSVMSSDASATGGTGGNGGAGFVRVTTLRGSGADLAETYCTNDGSIVPGDVVALDHNLRAGVKKTNGVYDKGAVGTISTSPGLVIGTTEEDCVKPVLVALSGRVPMRVSLENGPIRKGDLLTPSSAPGVAMRATKAGQVIGQAMTEYTDSDLPGYVVAFIKMSYAHGSKITDLLPPGLTAENVDEAPESILTEGLDPTKNIQQQILDYFLSNRALLEQSADLSEILTDRLGSALEIITPKVITDGLVVNTIGAGGTELNLLNDTIFFGRPYFNNDTAGFAVIRKGERFVDIKFDKEYLTQPVISAVISFDADKSLLDEELDPQLADQLRASQEARDETLFGEGYQFIITQKSTKGFRIYLNKRATIDIQFSWIALAVKDAKIIISEDSTSVTEKESDQVPTQTNPENSSASEVSDVEVVDYIDTDLQPTEEEAPTPSPESSEQSPVSEPLPPEQSPPEQTSP